MSSRPEAAHFAAVVERPLYCAFAFAVACSPPLTSTLCHSERSEEPPYFAFAVAFALAVALALALAVALVLACYSSLAASSQNAFICALFHPPQTIFHAFTQQNRMSSPKLTKKPITQAPSTR
jgi:hypothetical protein